MRTRKFPALIALLVAFAAVTAGAAGAQTATDSGTADVTATIDSTAITAGTRTVTALPVVLAQIAAGVATLDGSLSISVTEEAALGVADWYVTAEMTTPLTGGTTGATIPNSNLSVDPCTITSTQDLLSSEGGSLTTSTLSSTSTLASAVEMFRVTGEDPNSYYTNVITCASTMSLNLDGAVQTDAYTGQLTVTLFQ